MSSSRQALQALYGVFHEAVTRGELRVVALEGLPREPGLALTRELAQLLQGAGRRLAVVEADLDRQNPVVAAIRRRFALGEGDARELLRRGLTGLVTPARVDDAVRLLAGLVGAVRDDAGAQIPGLEPAVVGSERFQSRAVKTALNLLRYDLSRTPHLFVVPASPSARVGLDVTTQLLAELRDRPGVLVVIGAAPDLGTSASVVRVDAAPPRPLAPETPPPMAPETPPKPQRPPTVPVIAAVTVAAPSQTPAAAPPAIEQPTVVATAPMAVATQGAAETWARAHLGTAAPPGAVHRAAADWLATHDKAAMEERARHLELGDRPEAAAECLLELEHRLDRETATRALALVPRGHFTLGGRVARAVARIAVDYEDGALLGAAIEWLDMAPLSVLAARYVGRGAPLGWWLRSKEATTDSAAGNTDSLEDTLWWVAARMGDADPAALEASVARVENALRGARSRVNDHLVGRLVSALAELRSAEGRLEPAAGLFEEAIALLDSGSSASAAAWLGLHAVRRARGEAQAADEALARALESAPADHPVTARATLAEVGQLVLLNRVAEAERRLEASPELPAVATERLITRAALERRHELAAEAVTRARVTGHPSSLAGALLVSARTRTVSLFTSGGASGHDAALAELREAASLLTGCGRRRELLEVLDALSACALEAGVTGEARETAVRAEALRAQLVPQRDRALREARTIRREYVTSPIAAQDVTNILAQLKGPARKSRVDL